MENKTIVITEILDTKLAVSSEKGQKIREEITKNIDQNIHSTIDFSNIKTLTTAFLNSAIGELYRSNVDLNTYVKIDATTLTDTQKKTLKMVMDNSRQKYNKNTIKKIEEVTLHGDAN